MDFNYIQLLAGLGLAVLVAVVAYLAHSLNRSGMIAAILLGTIIFGLGGWNWAVLLLVFFISSSLLSKVFKRRKQRLDEKFSKGSQRDAAQVAANGGVAGLCVLLHIAFPNSIWPWVAFAGSLAAVNADTWATELGVLNRKPPRLITNGRIVEPGTSGGISLIGTLAALGGSFLIAFLAVVCWPKGTLIVPLNDIFMATVVITLAGLAGSLVDSLLGASFQAIYICPTCHKETERHPTHTCGSPTTLKRGASWLNNDWVNIACAVTGAILASVILSTIGMGNPLSSNQVNNYPMFNLSSNNFSPGETIPTQNSCDGQDQSPELTWQGYPSPATKSFALIMEDPDAPLGIFTHWLIYNIPSTQNRVPAGIPSDPQNMVPAVQGKNSFGNAVYNGPCPPSGTPHHYHFYVYALDFPPTLPAGLDSKYLQMAIKDHILAKAELMGTFGR